MACRGVHECVFVKMVLVGGVQECVFVKMAYRRSTGTCFYEDGM